MWDPWQVINCGYLNVKNSPYIWPTTNIVTSSIYYHQMKLVVPSLLYPWNFPSVVHFECAVKLKYFSMSPVFNCLLSNAAYCCPLTTSFTSFTLSLDHSSTAHSPFVHNVRLFIFHSCLLPCLFDFFPTLPFFFLRKKMYIELYWDHFEMC